MGIVRRVLDRRAKARGSEAVRIEVNGWRSYSHSRVMKTRLRWELVEKIGAERESAQSYPSQQILGIRFFDGDLDTAVAFMSSHGGFLVAPSGTCFARLLEDEPYRRAILAADLTIADS